MPRTLLLAALVSVTGCAVAPGDGAVSDRVTVIDRARGTEIAVTPDGLALPIAGNEDLLSQQPGDILVSGRDGGFLRKVVSVDEKGSQIEITTEPAALTDAILQADYTEEIHDAKWDWAGPKFAGVFLGFGGLEVQGLGGAKMTMTKGKLDFHPSLDLAMKMRRARVSQFDLVATGAFDAELGFKLETNGAAEIKYSKDLWTSPSATFVQMIGIVPVVEVVSVVVGLEVNASTEGQTILEVGASAHSSVSVGASYLNGVLHRVGEHSLTIRTEGPTLTTNNNAQVQVKMPIELHVSFYDLAGPYVSLEPYLQAEYTRAEGLKASWGTEGVVGGSVNLLGAGNDSRILGIEGTLFDFNCEFGTPVSECLK